MHIYNLRKNTQFCIDLRKFTCYNKTTVKTSTTDGNTKRKNKLNRQRVQNIFDTIAVGVSDCFIKNSHALRSNCNMFRQKSQQYYTKKKVIF